MANSALSERVSEQRLGELYAIAERFETIEHIKLYQFQDENQLTEYLSQRNYTNRDLIQAYRALVKGETGSSEMNPDYGPPEYHRYRTRAEYALQNFITGQQHYALEKLESGAKQWRNIASIKIEKVEKGKQAKTLADVKTYAEFRALRAKNPKIPERAWIYKQHDRAYQWEQLIHKYTDKDTTGVDTDEKKAAWEKDLTNVGLYRITTKEQFDNWRVANKTQLSDEVWEYKNDYQLYKSAEEWQKLRLERRYPARRLPRGLSFEEEETWKQDPRNKGFVNLKTNEEFQKIVEDYNQDVSDEKDKLTLDTLLFYRSANLAWTNPGKYFDELEEAKKVEAPVVEPSGVPEMRTSDYTPPPAAPFNYPYGTVGDPSEDLFYSPDEEDEAQEGEAGDPGTQAPVLERSSIPPFYDSSPSDDDETEEEDRSGAPSGRPSIRQIRNLTKLLRGGGTAATGAGGVGAAGAGTAGAASGGLAATTGAGTAVAVGGTAGGATVGFALVILGLVLLVILIIVLVVMFFGGASNNGEVSLSFTKSGPAAVANNEEIAYTLSANYPGEADDIVISDTLSEDVEIIDEKTSKPYTYNSASRRISWSAKQLASGSASTSAATTATVGAVDISKYTKSPFSLPSPNAESDRGYTSSTMQNLNELGSFITKHQSYLVTKAKNNNPVYVDPFVSVIWVGAIEGTEGNQFSWNCRDDRNIRINDGCSGGFASGRWQVGYGLQVAQAISHIEADFNEVYGANGASNAQQVASVGQKVIDQSASSSAGQITNPRFFPTETVSSLIIKARAGDIAAQQAIAVLLMDKELGAVSIAQEIAGDIAGQDNWRATMEGWSSYYSTNMQNFANRMKKISEQYSGGTGGTSTYVGSRTVTLTVRPKKENTYVINISNAQVLGARGKPGQSTGAGTAPNAENCQGKYVLNSSIAKNFGDPNCNFTPDGLANILREQDSANAELWYQIARCESGHNPNAWRDPNKEPKTPDPAGAWGLFQMGSAINGPGTFGNGRNGVYDRGDVEWPLQTSNAINYYKTILQPRGASIGAYWECAQ